MAHSPVISGATLAAGLKATFADAYNGMYEGVKSRLSKVMDLGMPSDKLTELYAYFQSAPHAVRWPRGDAIESRGFRSVGFSVTNYDWGRRVEWHANDRDDDQIKKLVDRARELGKNFALLPERVFYQFITNTADGDLMPLIPNAPDGLALFAAARFGLAAGNIVTGTGVATPMAIRADFFTALEQFRQFQDTEGQPLYNDDIVQGEFVLTYNVANDQVFREAFQQSRTIQMLGAGTGEAAAVTNIITEAGLKFELWPTQRITDNDWFVFATKAPYKAIFQQTRQPLREAFATMENSDVVRTTKMEYIQWDSREGYGVFLPFGAMQVNNP